MRAEGPAAERGVLRAGTPTDSKQRDEMFDETTAASIVSALRRWTGSSSIKEAGAEDAAVASPSVVQNGLEWNEALKGIAEAGVVELNTLVENLSETLGGARVTFASATSASAESLRPSIDVRTLSSEARSNLTPGQHLSTPLYALQPEPDPVQTALLLIL